MKTHLANCHPLAPHHEPVFGGGYQIRAAIPIQRIPRVRQIALKCNEECRHDAPGESEISHPVPRDGITLPRFQTRHQQRGGAFGRADSQNVQ